MFSVKSKNRIFQVLAFALLSSITIVVMFLFSPSWQDWQQANCMPHCFCEAVGQNKLLRQPANTFSSFAFVFTGTFILLANQSEKRFPEIYKIILGVAAVLIGVGSAFYHASLTFVGQFFDVLGMYLLVVFIFAYACERLFRFKRSTTLTIYFILNFILALLLVYAPETRRYLFAFVLLGGLIIEIFARRKRQIAIETRCWNYGFALFALAFLIWAIDNKRIICDPQSIIQGHAVWHLLGAIATLLLYLYYSSERPLIDSSAL